MVRAARNAGPEPKLDSRPFTKRRSGPRSTRRADWYDTDRRRGGRHAARQIYGRGRSRTLTTAPALTTAARRRHGKSTRPGTTTRSTGNPNRRCPWEVGLVAALRLLQHHRLRVTHGAGDRDEQRDRRPPDEPRMRRPDPTARRDLARAQHRSSRTRKACGTGGGAMGPHGALNRACRRCAPRKHRTTPDVARSVAIDARRPAVAIPGRQRRLRRTSCAAAPGPRRPCFLRR